MAEVNHVYVVTRNLSCADEPPRTAVIDHSEHSHRRWLGRHCFWAMRSNMSVTTYPTTDDLDLPWERGG